MESSATGKQRPARPAIAKEKVMKVRSLLIVSVALFALLAQVACAGTREPTLRAKTSSSHGRSEPYSVPVSTETPPADDPAAAVAVVHWLSPGLYQLDLQSTSGVGRIDQFDWVPPTRLTITAVTSSEGGRCTVIGGQIQCRTHLAPPSCTCRGGGVMSVNFTATGLDPTFANGNWTSYGIVGAAVQIQQVTPVPNDSPSSIPTSSPDLSA
jgi:hypothetical protein